MSTASVRRRRWTRNDYDRVVASGGFGPEDHIELLDGEIWEMAPQGTPHAAVCSRIHRVLQRAFGDACCVRSQAPFALDDVSEPEPDLAVVRGSDFDYLEDHPSEALLLVEVSESSPSHDRGRKRDAYARNGVPEYWLFDLATRRFEVYREPEGDRYAVCQVLTRDDEVSPLHAPTASIPVAELLPA